MAAENITPRAAAPLLRVAGLCKTYAQRRWPGRSQQVKAVAGVDLTLTRGTTLALVGESGSGKSTLARCLVRLEEPTAGEIWYEGRNLLALSRAELRQVRREIQLIFQDPAAALNPHLTAAEIVMEPLVIHRWGTRRYRLQRALDLMEQVGLLPRWSGRTPAQFSGGQRQRLAIARALTLEPRLLILDEALSALDLSIQAQIVNLLLELQENRGLAYLYITHDLTLVGHLADEVAVMQGGRIVERASARRLLACPEHSYSRALLAAVPLLEPSAPGEAAP